MFVNLIEVRTTFLAPLVADASKDRLQTGNVDAQDEIEGQSFLPGITGRKLVLFGNWDYQIKTLTVPKLSLALSMKAFCVSALTFWNSLSVNYRETELVSSLKSRLKTNCLA